MLKPRQGLADWEVFSELLRLAIVDHRQIYRHTPGQKALIMAGHIKLVRASYDHHGGLPSCIASLGFPPAVRMKSYPSGLNNWQAFQAAFEPIANCWFNRYGRLPSKRELERAGHGQYSRAAYRHHRGLPRVYRRFGYKPRDCKRNGHPYAQDWYDPRRRLAVLEARYPELLSWGIGPSSTAVCRDLHGLARFSWSRQGWPALMAEDGLMPYYQGIKQRRTAEAIIEVLQFLELHHRWPKIRECARDTQRRYYESKLPWEKFTEQLRFHPRVLDHLIEPWRRHHLWSATHGSPREYIAHRMVNALIIQRHISDPFGRSSP